MTEIELQRLWSAARWHIIVSQIAPTALLGFTIWLAMNGLSDASLAVRIAATGILLASGILGAVAQFTAATEGLAIATELSAVTPASSTSARVVTLSPMLNVVRFVTPAVFVVVFVALLVEFFAG